MKAHCKPASVSCTVQWDATLREATERLEAEAAALEAACHALEVENTSIEAVMKLRVGAASLGAPMQARRRVRLRGSNVAL